MTDTSPSETVTAAKTTVLITDARSRIIKVRKLNALQFYQLTKAMGATSSNAGAMDLAVIASSVARIDATDFAPPRTETDVSFLIQQLDFDGLAAAGEGLKQLSGNSDDGIEAAKN